MKRYYSLMRNGNVADIDIYGDIRRDDWMEKDVSAYSLAKDLEELSGVSLINVHINSYGGDVGEGLAIYNALLRNPARVVTTCDGMACSIASVIMMAGDERIMADASMMMIHNAWMFASGDANTLRKQADDLEIINSASKKAYLSRVSIDDDELTRLMDAETWITPEQALSMGFATSISLSRSNNPSQSAIRSIMQSMKQKIDLDVDENDDEDDDLGESGDEDPDTDPDTDGNPDETDDDGDSADGDDGDGSDEDPDSETDDADGDSDDDSDSNDDSDEDPPSTRRKSQSAINLVKFLRS